MSKRFKGNFSSGFTLIELLVDIAIIGILSAVVLTQLNSARGKSIDAQKKANFKNLINPAILYYEINDTYAGVCSDPSFQNIYTAAGASGYCSSPNNYRVRVRLHSEDLIAPSGADWICTDPTGNIKTYGVDPGASGNPCP